MFAALALWATSAMATVDWSTATNLAYGKSVTVGSISMEDSGVWQYYSQITDGNTGTGFRSNPTYVQTINDFFFIDLESSQAITDIKIWWNCHPTTYTIYVTDNVPTYTTYNSSGTVDDSADLTNGGYRVLDSDWLTANASYATTCGDNSSSYLYDAYQEEISVSGSGRYIVFYSSLSLTNPAITYGNWLWELMAAYDEDSSGGTGGTSTTTIASLVVGNCAAYKGVSTGFAVVAYDSSGSTVDLSSVSGLTVTADNSAATITETSVAGTYSIVGSEYGIYTITASYTNADSTTVTATGTFNVNFDWENNTNVALGKTAYASGEASSDYAAGKAIDGDTGTRWAPGQTWYEDVWIYIDLGATYTMTAVTALWDCYPYISEYYYATESGGTDNWIFIDSIDATGYTWTVTSSYEDAHDLSTPVTGRYFKMLCHYSSASQWGYGASAYEIRIAGTLEESEVGKISSLSITGGTIYKGESTTVTVTATTADGASADLSNISDLTVTADSASVTITATDTVGVYTVTGGEYGIYTLTATGTASDNSLSATSTLNVGYDWTGKTNVACVSNNASATATASDYTTGYEPALAIDGNTGTRWAAGYIGYEKEIWMYVDLGATYTISSVLALWESVPTYYQYYYATTTDTDGEPVWSELSEKLYPFTWTANGYEDPYELSTAVEARYVKVYFGPIQSSNWGYSSSVYELEVVGTLNESETGKISSLSITGGTIYKGESTTVTVSALTADGSAADLSNISDLTVTADSASVTVTATDTVGVYTVTGGEYGIYTLTATGTASETTLTATNTLNVGYDWTGKTNVACVSNNSSSSATASDYTTGYEAALAIDGDTGTRWAAGYIGYEKEIWMYVDLGTTYTISSVLALWESVPTYYQYYYATTTDTDGEPVWSELSEKLYPFTWTANGYEDPYDLSEAVVARYVKVYFGPIQSSNWGYSSSVYELEVVGEIYTGISLIGGDDADADTPVNVYNLQGMPVRTNVLRSEATQDLVPGFYIIGNEKVIVK